MIEVPDSLRGFLAEHGLDVDAIMDDGVESEVVLEAVASPETREVLKLVRQVHSADIKHKLLFGAALFEMRTQIKKTQAELADHRKQHQRDFNKLFDLLRENHDQARKKLAAMSLILKYVRDFLPAMPAVIRQAVSSAQQSKQSPRSRVSRRRATT